MRFLYFLSATLFTAVLVFSGQSAFAAPAPSIGANGQAEAVEVRPGETISIELALDVGESQGLTGDWWLVVIDLDGKVQYLDPIKGFTEGLAPTYAGQLFTFPAVSIPLANPFPVGAYTFCFAVDLSINGIVDLDSVYFDIVTVYVADTYSSPIDETKIVTSLNDNGIEIRFPANELVVIPAEGITKAQLKHLLVEYEGNIVGEMPEFNIFQVRFPTKSQAALDLINEELLSHSKIETAGYNLLAERSTEKCIPDADVDNVDNHLLSACAFQDVEYMPALTVFEALRSQVTLASVNVAVIEKGFDQNHSELNHLKPLNLNAPSLKGNFKIDDHGTMVLGVLAAKNDGNNVNGLASRFLGSNLKLSLGSGKTIFESFAAVQRAITYVRSAVINMSCYWDRKGFRRAKLDEKIFDNFGKLIKKSTKTIFVVSAINTPIDISNSDFFPAGFESENLITVGGTAYCQPTTKWPASAFGNSIDIAAPASAVPVVKTTSLKTINNGNSFAAPMVASAAAIMKSMNPSLTGAQLKSLILETARRAGALSPVGGKRLSFSAAIIKVLWDKYSGNPAVKYVLNPLADIPEASGGPFTAGDIIGGLCGSTQYSVKNFGSYSMSASELSGQLFVENGFCAILQRKTPSMVTASFGCYNCKFALNSEIPVNISWSLGEKGETLGWSDPPIGGNVVFQSCKIVQRPHWSPGLEGEKTYYIQTDGQFSGPLLIASVDNPKPVPSNIQGNFDIVLPFDTSNMEYLEKNCKGGEKARVIN